MVDREKLIRMVTALQKGDPTAAEEIYDTCYDDTYYFIKSTVLDPELAADLTQDTFVEVLEKIHTLQEPAAFVSWLRRIAYNKSVNYFKKSKAEPAGEDEDGNSVFEVLEEDRAEFIPDKALDQEDFKATILSMLQTLPETQRSALVLHYYEERSVQEIAEIQGVSQGTVKSRLNYSRNAIKQSVESYEKKNGIKLHCVGVAPILLWLFGQGVLVRDGSVICAGFAGITTATATQTAVAATTAATVKTAITTKIIAAVAAAAVIISGAAIAISQIGKDDNNKNISTPEQQNENDNNKTSENPTLTTPEEKPVVKHKFNPNLRFDYWENAIGIYFIYSSIPEGVEVHDYSEAQDGSILGWREETQDIGELDTSSSPYYNYYFTTIDGGTILAPEDCSGMLWNSKSFLQTICFDNFDTSNTTNMSNMFAGCNNLQQLDLSNFDTSNVTNMSHMFDFCASLIALDLSCFDTSKVTSMSSMFELCTNLSQLNVSSFNTSSVKHMEYMFSGCRSLNNLNVSNFDTSNVTGMEAMFRGCSSLQTLELSNFNTSNVTDMFMMFNGCHSLQYLDISNFDTSKVTQISGIFGNCENLKNLDYSGFVLPDGYDEQELFFDGKGG